MSGAEPTMAELKRALRSAVIAERAKLSQSERAARSHAIVERAQAVPALGQAGTVALYAPLGTEVDSDALAWRLLARGARVCYPRAVPDDRRLVFARAEPPALVRGPLGAKEPAADARVVDLAEIECVVIPGIAFSLDGFRLGRGGGYYDVTLAQMPRASRVALAFALQLLPSIPHEAHDAPLDALVTEDRVLTFGRANPVDARAARQA